MKIISFITAIFVTFGCITLQGQVADEITIPAQEKDIQWLKVDIKYGGIEIIGSDRKDVHIRWEQLSRHKEQVTHREDGLKRISSGESGLSIEQKDQIIDVSASSFTSGYKITVEVPHKMNLDLSSFNRGDLSASNIDGEVTMHTYNGKIEAHKINGSVNANTFNGDITIEFDKVTLNTPMEFITYNGDVDLTLPSNTKASFRIRTKGGEILTGFDMEMKKAQTLKKEQKSDGSSKVILDGWIYGDINGGGPQVELENSWGNIYIRKKD